MKIIGFLMLFIPLILITKNMVKNDGWLVTFAVWILICLFVAYIKLAIYLMGGSTCFQ